MKCITPVNEPLPLTVAGLRTLFYEITTEFLAVHTGHVAGPANKDAVFAYCGVRMPAVFAATADSRPAAVAAVDLAEDLVSESEPPGKVWTWPVDPAWQLEMVIHIVTVLVSTLAEEEIHIPGGTALVDRWERSFVAQIHAAVDDDGEHHAVTEWFSIPSRSRAVQVGLQTTGETVVLRERERGAKKWRELGRFTVGEERNLRMLLTWFESTFDQPVLDT